MRPADGGRRSPPRKTPDRHQVGASGRGGVPVSPARAARRRCRASYRDRLAAGRRRAVGAGKTRFVCRLGGGNWGRGRGGWGRGAGGEPAAGGGSLSAPATKLTVLRSRLPYFPSRAAPERSAFGGAGATAPAIAFFSASVSRTCRAVGPSTHLGGTRPSGPLDWRVHLAPSAGGQPYRPPVELAASISSAASNTLRRKISDQSSLPACASVGIT